MLDARAARLESKQATREEVDAAQTTLQLVFFDGEEAFKAWTATDSIYGSRYVIWAYLIFTLTEARIPTSVPPSDILRIDGQKNSLKMPRQNEVPPKSAP